MTTLLVPCSLSGIGHEDRPAEYTRLAPDGSRMWYCRECRLRLPPEPYNLAHPPLPVSEYREPEPPPTQPMLGGIR